MGIAGVAAAVGAAAAVAGAASSISSSGGGGSAGGAGTNNDSSNAIYGVHVSTQATSMGQGNPNPKPTVMQAPKADKATVATARETPTQGASQNAAQGKQDYQNQWADKLSKYLDYNTRNLG